MKLIVFLSFFFSFFYKPYHGLQNCKSVFLILKISQYGGLRPGVYLFQRYSYKNWYKDWCVNFYKTFDYEICQAATSTGFNSNETNETGEVNASRSRDKLKSFLLFCQTAYGQQIWKDFNLLTWMVSWSRGLVTPYDKLKLLNPLYQTWQGDNLPP